MPEKQPRRFTWQIGLRSLFLLTTAIAVWTVYYSNTREIDRLELRIADMRPLVRELVVEDEEQFAVVKLEQHWYDENRWSVYVPSGEFRLYLATREIDEEGLAPVVASVPLAAGRHLLAHDNVALPDDEGWRVTVHAGERLVLSTEEPQEWNPAFGWSEGGQFDRSEQLPADKPMVLFRRRFTQPAPGGRSTTPTGPTDGIMLWIEPAGGARDDP
ncbi:MAG: hypothetical protein WD872_17365 [Pirellulaceae bacterium]